MENGEHLTHTLQPDRHAWLQVARGSLELNGIPLKAGDGVAINEEQLLTFEAQEKSEILLFDLA